MCKHVCNSRNAGPGWILCGVGSGVEVSVERLDKDSS